MLATTETITVIRTEKVSFHAHPRVIDELFACNRLSADVWNTCLEEAEEYHLETGKWIGQTELQKRIKRRFPLHSQCIQAVCHKYLRARDGAHAAKKNGHSHIRYPYKRKKHFNTRWAKDGFTIHANGRIELSRGIWKGKRQIPLVVYVTTLPKGTIKEIELLFDRKLMLAVTYEAEVESSTVSGEHRCAIDLGEIHTIAAVATTGKSVIITGRKVRSIRRLRNKKLAELQRKMSHCQRYSRQWKKYNRAKQYLLSKSERQLRDALHKTTKQFVEWAAWQQVNEVVVGKLDGVGRHTSKRKKKKVRSRRHNQRMSQWAFGRTTSYLGYKLQVNRIKLRKEEESFTSQTCPVCTRRKKVSGRVYQCKCGYTQHRDIHGAGNFLAKVWYGGIQQLPFPILPPMYLRIA
ncbi:transposase [Brevibacillus ruminantium]|uniref:Transposase n=1 Tax=Brevibacillus ruminantium TaxID=2950604 RepID=A0ABY4WC46_9BACL|nr:transposase [Brevibacillus ruminantium]USG64479.1 transposase [Brevibacillus ruminantium]